MKTLIVTSADLDSDGFYSASGDLIVKGTVELVGDVDE